MYVIPQRQWYIVILADISKNYGFHQIISQSDIQCWIFIGYFGNQQYSTVFTKYPMLDINNNIQKYPKLYFFTFSLFP